ncbi:hypothetical protein DXG01_000403 [Tephrocybe rancida]|nr:hypothetical protein DXG01_000403 [Tephrocybe rancida]
MATSINIDDSDYSAVTYKGNWDATGTPNEFDGTAHGTSVAGAQATVKFRGTNIAVFGTVEFGTLGNAGTPNSSYMLDNATPTLFPGFPVINGAAYDRRFFHSPSNLDPNVEHTLVITLVVTGGNRLWLDRFAVGRDAVTTTSEVPAPSPVTTSKEGGGAVITTTAVIDSQTSTSLLSTVSHSSSSISISPHPPSTSDSLYLYSSTSTTGQATGSTTDPLGQSQSTTTIDSSTSSSASGLSKGTTIGISVGVAAAVILLSLIGLLLFCLLRKRKSARRASTNLIAEPYVPVAWNAGYVVRGGRSSEKPDPYYAQQAPSTIALVEPQPPIYQEDMPLVPLR